MLMVSSYAKDDVDACRAKVGAQLASHRKVLAAKPLEVDAFEGQFFNHMILALDHYFVHRGRGMEGKDRQSPQPGANPVRCDHGKTRAG